MREIERSVLLRSVDRHWIDHISAMDDLRQGINLRAYGQMDPVVAYKKEGFDMFEMMIGEIQEETVRTLMAISVEKPQAIERKSVVKNVHEGPAVHSGGGTDKAMPRRNSGKKVGRNDDCPCGSGKKYKHCCGANPQSL